MNEPSQYSLGNKIQPAKRYTVGQAREKYFRENGFGEDGGYNKKWIYLKFGWLTIPVYNSQARRRAVPLHDLHHIATGFSTDPQGEAQVAIWELASGTHDKWFAFFINVPALIYGFVMWPKVAQQAWQLGRRSKNLYAQEYDEKLLEISVAELREKTVGG